MPKVLVAGDANVDLIVPFPRFLNDRRTLVEYPNPCLAGPIQSKRTSRRQRSWLR